MSHVVNKRDSDHEAALGMVTESMALLYQERHGKFKNHPYCQEWYRKHKGLGPKELAKKSTRELLDIWNVLRGAFASVA